MSNIINNETKKKEFLKKKLKTMIITYSAFAIIVFILVLLKKYSLISSNFYLIPFYLIMAIIAFGIMIVLACQMNKVCRKKEPGVSLCLGFIGIFLLVAFGIAIDIRKELIDFSKNATKIDALIIDIDKKVEFVEECKGGTLSGNYCKSYDLKRTWQPREFYEVHFIYDLQYVVKNQTYTSKYSDYKNKEEFKYKEGATNWKSKYNKGDYITIYYDNDNPESIKGDFALGFGIAYFFEVIAILFQIVYFVKHKKYMKEVVK